MAEAPKFDATRKVLAFALNYNGSSIPRPAMTRAMAEVPAHRSSRKAARKRAEAQAALGINEPQKGARSFMGVRLPTGLEAAYLAGTILRHFETLAYAEQLAIIVSVTKPKHPCSCKAPCCSGWRANPRWLGAFHAVIARLKDGADVVGVDPARPGRGLSTQPGLRQALVEDYFLNLEYTAAALAAEYGVSRDTVSKHRDWIWTYLDALTNQAWQAADRLFDEAGLVGVTDIVKGKG